MNVQDLKRWHWAVVAIVVGLALSFVWANVDWNDTLPTIGQRDFEAGLITKYPQVGHLANVTVMPPEEGKYRVLAEQVRATKNAGEIEMRPVAYVADTPYKSGTWRGADEQFPNVREYLKQAQASDNTIAFKYAWYREKWAVYMLWTGASLLLIGGVWPSVVSLMVGAGLGLKREEQGPEYDLERFKGEQDKKGAKHVPTAAEIQHLRDLEDELEKKLAAQRAGLPIPEDEPAAATAGPAKKLDGGPLEEFVDNKPPEDHDYKGEFYPVDRHLPKKKQ